MILTGCRCHLAWGFLQSSKVAGCLVTHSLREFLYPHRLGAGQLRAQRRLSMPRNITSKIRKANQEQGKRVWPLDCAVMEQINPSGAGLDTQTFIPLSFPFLTGLGKDPP